MHIFFLQNQEYTVWASYLQFTYKFFYSAQVLYNNTMYIVFQKEEPMLNTKLSSSKNTCKLFSSSAVE